MTQQQYDRNLKVIDLARSGKVRQCYDALTKGQNCHCYTGLVLDVYEQETGRKPGQYGRHYLLPRYLWSDFMGWPSESGPYVQKAFSIVYLNDSRNYFFFQLADLHEKWLREQVISG